METSSDSSSFMLIFRGNEWQKGLSPEQMQHVAGQWKAWFDGLAAQGKVKGGAPLEHSGKIISGKNGRIVADGPFAESKEAIGGYFLLEVKSLEEAVAIAKGCPGLAHGCSVEVRPVAQQCPCAEPSNVATELAAHA